MKSCFGAHSSSTVLCAIAVAASEHSKREQGNFIAVTPDLFSVETDNDDDSGVVSILAT
jgi:hypothetical protein